MAALPQTFPMGMKGLLFFSFRVLFHKCPVCMLKEQKRTIEFCPFHEPLKNNRVPPSGVFYEPKDGFGLPSRITVYLNCNFLFHSFSVIKQMKFGF